MTWPYKSLFLLTAVAAALACTREGVGPDAGGAPSPGVAAVELIPGAFYMPPGGTLQLIAVPRDQRGAVMSAPQPISYGSDAPHIATVNAAGVVTGVAPGSATISATVSGGAVTARAAMVIHVTGPDAPEQLLLTAGESGWQPAVAELVVGGTVRWSRAHLGWGAMLGLVYLMDASYTVVDSVDLCAGVATHRFMHPGTVRYCAGSCWDPHEFGVLHVR